MTDITIIGVNKDKDSFAVLADNEDGTLYAGWVSRDIIYNNLQNIRHISCVDDIISVVTYELSLDEIRDFIEKVNVIENFIYEIEVSKLVGTICCMSIRVDVVGDKSSGGKDTSGYYPVAIDSFCREDIEDWLNLEEFNDKELFTLFCSKDADFDKAISTMRFLIMAYDLKEFHGWYRSVPVMSFLKNGNLMDDYNNPYNGKKFRKEYGVEENPVFKHPLMDNVILFKDSKGTGYIFSSPSLSSIEIRQIMNCLDTNKSYDKHGSYKGLEYSICGKKLSFHNPGNSNLVIFKYNEELDKNE